MMFSFTFLCSNYKGTRNKIQMFYILINKWHNFDVIFCHNISYLVDVWDLMTICSCHPSFTGNQQSNTGNVVPEAMINRTSGFLYAQLVCYYDLLFMLPEKFRGSI